MGYKRRALSIVDKIIYALPSDTLPTYYEGYWFWIPKINWTTILNKYEQYMAHALKSHLNPGDTFWDIGANIGIFSMFAAKVTGPKGRVFSFEPAPDVFELLSTNIQKIASIKAVQCGVGNADTVATFASQGDSAAGSFVENVTKMNEHFHPNTPIQKVEVNIRKVDTLVEELGSRPNIAKIDVEGFEIEVLKGADILLSTSHPILIIEIHPPQIVLSDGNEDMIFAILKKHCYKWSVIDHKKNSIYTILAEHDITQRVP